MNFEVGDKVRVKSYEEIKKTLDSDSIIHYYYKGDRKYLSFNGEMISFCENVYTISDISCNGNYELENDEGTSWWFADDWLEKVVEEKPYYVSSFGDINPSKAEELKSILDQIDNLVAQARNLISK